MTPSQLKAKLLKIKMAQIVSGDDIIKKNKINRDLDKDTGGNKDEQDLVDMISEMAGKGKSKKQQESINRQISKGMNSKTFKKKGTFTIRDWK